MYFRVPIRVMFPGRATDEALTGSIRHTGTKMELVSYIRCGYCYLCLFNAVYITLGVLFIVSLPIKELFNKIVFIILFT